MKNLIIKELIDLSGWKPSRCIHCVGWIKDNPERNKNNKYCNRCKFIGIKIWFIENKNSKSFKLKRFFKKIYCRIFKFSKKIFHKHNWEKVGFREEHDEYRNMMYDIKIYKCSECGKVKEIDGRYKII